MAAFVVTLMKLPVLQSISQEALEQPSLYFACAWEEGKTIQMGLFLGLPKNIVSKMGLAILMCIVIIIVSMQFCFK